MDALFFCLFRVVDDVRTKIAEVILMRPRYAPRQNPIPTSF